MESKKYVLSIYPEAFAKLATFVGTRLIGSRSNGYIIYLTKSIAYHSGEGLTEELAWEAAKESILNK